jgi:hypothetical protein
MGEVEAIVGRFHRPNLHAGREYFAWIGEGGMLRASFNGPGRTLSATVLDTAEERRPLDLGPDLRRRTKQSTTMQAWYCIPCRQRYRQPQSGRAVICAVCGCACERAIGSIRVPSPKYAKAWDKFWVQYRAEMELLDADRRGELREAVRLELFDVSLPKSRRRTRRSDD